MRTQVSGGDEQAAVHGADALLRRQAIRCATTRTSPYRCWRRPRHPCRRSSSLRRAVWARP
jgi:hypothetical protein